MAVTTAPPPPQAPPASPRLPDLGPIGTLRWMWRRLTSMRTALILLLLLAIATIPGSLLPQRSVDLGAVAEFYQANPDLAPVLERLGLFAVYSSPWFGAVYLLLFVSLVGCIIPRTRAHVLDWFAAPPNAPTRLNRLPGYVTYRSALPPDEAAAQIAAAVRGRWSVGLHRVTSAPGTSAAETSTTRPPDQREPLVVAAQTGRLRETGNVIFHISMIGILLALAGSSLYSWRGEALVVEGAGFANTLPRYDSFTSGARYDTGDLPPFALTLDGLDVRFESDQIAAFGAPRDFAAAVRITDTPGAPPRSELIRVNQPASVDGARVYLSGNGYAPVVDVRNGNGELVFSGAVPFLPRDGTYTSTGVIKVPDLTGGGTEDLALEGFFLPTAVIDDQGPRSVFPDADNPRLLLTVATGDLGLESGGAGSVFSLQGADVTTVTADGGDAVSLLLAPGTSVDLPDDLGTVTFVELRRFAAFDVRADPSGPVALGAAVLVMVGLAMSLFIPERRAWIRITPTTGPEIGARSVVEVAGQSRPRDNGLGAALEHMAAVVRRSAPPVPPENDHRNHAEEDA